MKIDSFFTFNIQSFIATHRLILVRSLLFAASVLGCYLIPNARAEGEDSPTGTAQPLWYVDQVTSAGSYNSYTGSTSRTVTDLAVPGGVGTYSLAYSRTSTSRYDPASDSTSHSLGQGGCWSDSYNWNLYLDNPGGQIPVWRVHYPNGRVVRFTSGLTVAVPSSSSPTPPADQYLRAIGGGIGDRLELVSGAASKKLHLTDGGTVFFSLVSGSVYHPMYVFDPYNQATYFTYYTSGVYINCLQRITEPAGRYLAFQHTTVNGWNCVSSITASNGQSVNYNYTVKTGANNTSYVVLDNVVYNSDKNDAGQARVATYTYQPDNTGVGLRPLLNTCYDPHFAGALSQITYGFVQGSSAVYGQILGEYDSTTGVPVSSYSQSNHTETRGDGPTSTFNYSSYLVTGRQDHDNQTTNFSYDSNNYVNGITNPNTHSITVTNEPYTGNRLSVTQIDTNNQPLTTVFNYGGTAQTPYPLQPYWVIKITDPRGQVTVYTRDPNHQITRIDYPDSTYETFGYNGFGQITSHRAANGNTYSFNFDGSGNLTSSTDSFNQPLNRYTYYYYDAIGRVNQIVDFNNHNIWFTYNGRHLLQQLKHEDYSHVDYTYDDFGKRLTTSDELQHVTTRTYDQYHRTRSITVPISSANGTARTTYFTYERGVSGQPGYAGPNANTLPGYGTKKFPSGKQVKRLYTGDGRLKSETRGYGTSDATTDTYAYDPAGNLKTVTDANNIVQMTYGYDQLDRKSTLTDANGHITTWTYYPAGSAYAGWPYSVTSPGPSLGSTATTYYTTYDSMGRLLGTQDPSGNSVTKAYDGYGRLAFVRDANGGYTYGFDALSRRSSLTFPDQTTQTWTYDPVGNLTSYKNRAGNVKTINYDDRDRLYSANWSGNAAPATSWTYDYAGRLTDLNNSNVALHYTFEDSGLQLSEQNTNYLSNNCVNTTSYTRDADGNISGMVYPTGEQPAYTYDNQNRCIGLGTPSFMWSHLYFQGEQVVTRALGNNVASEYWYQANNRVSQIWHHHGGADHGGTTWPASNITSRLYGYAPNGQLTWCDHMYDGGSSGSNLEYEQGDNYKYYNDGSVCGFGMLYGSTYQSGDVHGDSNANPSNFSGAPGAAGTGSYANSYQYDGAGNRQFSISQMGSSVSYTADGENRYSGWSFDTNGNATNDAAGWTYTYNAEGQLTVTTRQSDGNTVYFAYDGVGRMICRWNVNGGYIMCYAGVQRIEERSKANNTSVYRYFFDAPGSDRITFRQATTQTLYGPRMYQQYDVVGNTTHVTDDNGNVLEQYLYDAYGTPYTYSKSGNYLGWVGTQNNRFLFHGSSGYEWQSTMKIYYCRARFYSAWNGRFLQPDPIGFQGRDINLYRYCHNDPINCSDPSGHGTIYVYNQDGTVSTYQNNDRGFDTGDNDIIDAAVIAGGAYLSGVESAFSGHFSVNGAARDTFTKAASEGGAAAIYGDKAGEAALKGAIKGFINNVAGAVYDTGKDVITGNITPQEAPWYSQSSWDSESSWDSGSANLSQFGTPSEINPFDGSPGNSPLLDSGSSGSFQAGNDPNAGFQPVDSSQGVSSFGNPPANDPISTFGQESGGTVGNDGAQAGGAGAVGGNRFDDDEDEEE